MHLTVALLALVALATADAASEEPKQQRCYVLNTGCPGSVFRQPWWSEDMGKITAGWCTQSVANCVHCGGEFCGDEMEVHKEPANIINSDSEKCYIRQCGCPGDFSAPGCTEVNAILNSPWCNAAAANCEACSGILC